MTNKIFIHTANILGIFTDPFEFEGDYGSEVNLVRQKVFDLVVSKEALSKNLEDSGVRALMQAEGKLEQTVSDYRDLLVKKAVAEEKKSGPTLSELVTPELMKKIEAKQAELQSSRFTESDLMNITRFVERYKDVKVFHFLRNNPSDLLGFDKILRDKAAREGKDFDLPILGSTKSLEGHDGFTLKSNLLEALFTEETLSSAKPEDRVLQSLHKLKEGFLQKFLGEGANNAELDLFASPAGQAFFFWMYQALSLHLVAQDPSMIEQVNKVKDVFVRTLGDPVARANALRDKLIAANSGVLFTQESDALVAQTLTRDDLFLNVDSQNPKDGTFVFLRSDQWEPNYEVIAIEDYEGSKTGRINVILATRKDSGEKFLLASCHGNSSRPEDGRLQITRIMEKFRLLSETQHLRILIGADANTKSEEDVKKFKEHLDSLGLTATDTGPTTVKKRMVTAQHSKSGKVAVDEEDFLITLKQKDGEGSPFSNPTVGFRKEGVDINRFLPDIDNPSDHYAVGATASL